MPNDLRVLSMLLTAAGIRHHADSDEGVIRVVFVTRSYTNLRAEPVAVVTVAVIDAGRVWQATIQRAFSAGPDPGFTCLQLSRLIGGFPGVGFAYDEDSSTLSLAAALLLEDAVPTAAQVCALLDCVVLAAEAGHEQLVGPESRRRPHSMHASRRRAC